MIFADIKVLTSLRIVQLVTSWKLRKPFGLSVSSGFAVKNENENEKQQQQNKLYEKKSYEYEDEK